MAARAKRSMFIVRRRWRGFGLDLCVIGGEFLYSCLCSFLNSGSAKASEIKGRLPTESLERAGLGKDDDGEFESSGWKSGCFGARIGSLSRPGSSLMIRAIRDTGFAELAPLAARRCSRIGETLNVAVWDAGTGPFWGSEAGTAAKSVSGLRTAELGSEEFVDDAGFVGGEDAVEASFRRFLFLRRFGFVWILECLVSSSDLRNRLLQPGNEHEWGFSPVCVRMCRVWCSSLWKALSHMGHLYGLEVGSFFFSGLTDIIAKGFWKSFVGKGGKEVFVVWL